MEDFFLQYSKGMSKENLSMRKAALAAMPSGPVPCVAAAGSATIHRYRFSMLSNPDAECV